MVSYILLNESNCLVEQKQPLYQLVELSISTQTKAIVMVVHSKLLDMTGTWRIPVALAALLAFAAVWLFRLAVQAMQSARKAGLQELGPDEEEHLGNVVRRQWSQVSQATRFMLGEG